MAKLTFHCVTANSFHGSIPCEGFGTLLAYAERLPQQRAGKDVWRLMYIFDRKTLRLHEVLTSYGSTGVEEARDFLSEGALHWRGQVSSLRGWKSVDGDDAAFQKDVENGVVRRPRVGSL